MFGTVPAVLMLVTTALPAQTQQGCCGQTYHAAEFQVSNTDASVAFYHDVLGLDFPPGWNGKSNPPGGGNSELTGAVGGLIRVVAMPIPGASWHVQVVETSGVDRKRVAARRQDAGATGLILYVRDIDKSVGALKKAGARILTVGGKPINIDSAGTKRRAIIAQDPDGFFVEVRQMDPSPSTSAVPASNIIDARMSLTIADTDQTARYWSEVLGMDVKSEMSFHGDPAELALQGVRGAEIRKTIAKVRPDGKFIYARPELVYELQEFKNIDRRKLMPRYQDPGSGAFVFRLKIADSNTRGKEMADLVNRLRSSPETRILTVGNNALDQGRRFAIFFQELNGFIVEVTQSTQ